MKQEKCQERIRDFFSEALFNTVLVLKKANYRETKHSKDKIKLFAQTVNF